MKKTPVILSVILTVLLLALVCFFSMDRSHAASRRAETFARCLSEGRYRKAYRMLQLPEGKSLSREEFEAEGQLLVSLLLQERVPEEILVSDPEFADGEKERCQVTVTYLTGSETRDLSLTLVKAGSSWKIADYS